MAFPINFTGLKLKNEFKPAVKKEHSESVKIVSGIIVEKDGVLQVQIDSNYYKFTQESYNLKNKDILYTKIDNKFVKVIMDPIRKLTLNGYSESYIPFKPGLKVKGTLVLGLFNFKSFAK